MKKEIEDKFKKIILDGYKSRYEFAKAMARPGISFTKEQEKQIWLLTEEGKIVEAQKIILDEIKKSSK